MAKPTNKAKSSNKNNKVVPAKRDHKPGVAREAGEVERRLEFEGFCYELATKGYSRRDIAQKLAAHFKLSGVPSHNTIAAYVRGAVTYRKESIADRRDAFLAVALPRLEQIVRNLLPIATNASGQLYVRRGTKHFGQEEEVLDEDSFYEQAKACEVIVKVTEQARKLLGIGIAADGKDEAALTEGRMQALISQTVMNNFTAPEGIKSIGQLALSSGEAEIDEMESGSF